MHIIPNTSTKPNAPPSWNRYLCFITDGSFSLTAFAILPFRSTSRYKKCVSSIGRTMHIKAFVIILTIPHIKHKGCSAQYRTALLIVLILKNSYSYNAVDSCNSISIDHTNISVLLSEHKDDLFLNVVRVLIFIYHKVMNLLLQTAEDLRVFF